MVSCTIAASLAVLALCIGTAFPQLAHRKLKLSVYYEADDDHSNKFLPQVQKAYASFGSKWLDIELVPFGLSNMDIKDKKCEVTCGNQKKSCDLDKFAACGITVLGKNTDSIVKFAACIATSSHSTFRKDSTCARLVKLHSEDDPYVCAKSQMGYENLCDMGKKTPKDISSVPLIYVDGKNPSKKDEDEIKKDLSAYICKHLSMQPEPCKRAPHMH